MCLLQLGSQAGKTDEWQAAHVTLYVYDLSTRLASIDTFATGLDISWRMRDNNGKAMVSLS